MDLITSVNILILAGCMGSFMWGAARHFRRVDGVPLAMSVLSILSVLSFLWLAARLGLGHRSKWWVISITAELGCVLVFWWAIRSTAQHRLSLAFCDDAPTRLLTAGPYRLVRHPFYACYVGFWIAGAANVTGLSTWLIPTAAMIVYYRAAMQEEAKFSRSHLAEAYVVYRASTGLLLPRLRPPRHQARPMR